MSNQYSNGCGYNYRRSMPREISSPCVTNTAAVRPAKLPFPIAMGYVPMQIWSQPMAPARGLQLGTIFADLNKPFCGRGGAWK